MPGQGERVYVPDVILGVKATGDKQELAKEFLRCLLSEPVQRYELYEGFSVNNGAIRQQTDKVTRDTYEISVGESSFLYMYPSPEVRRAVADSFSQLKTPALADFSLYDAVSMESEALYTGNATAQEVAEKIAGRYKLARMEKQ